MSEGSNERLIVVLPRYLPRISSSRLRLYSMDKTFREFGDVVYEPFFDTEVPIRQSSRLRAGLKTLAAVARRFRVGFRCRISRRDVWLIVQHEPLARAPRWVQLLFLRIADPDALIIDHDDAFYLASRLHHREVVDQFLPLPATRRHRALWRKATAVVAGNSLIALDVRENVAAPIDVRVIPTSVTLDFSRRRDRTGFASKRGSIRVGWVGSHATVRIFEEFCGSLSKHMDHLDPGIEFVAIGPPDWSFDTCLRVTHVAWSEEIDQMLDNYFEVGIMPLESDAFQTRKCAYKAIQYMAAGLPVVASDVGINREVVTGGPSPAGIVVQHGADWVEALNRLSASPSERMEMGTAGRIRAQELYSNQVALQSWSSLLGDVARGGRQLT